MKALILMAVVFLLLTIGATVASFYKRRNCGCDARHCEKRNEDKKEEPFT